MFSPLRGDGIEAKTKDRRQLFKKLEKKHFRKNYPNTMTFNVPDEERCSKGISKDIPDFWWGYSL